jgi:hypothetical protein
VATVTVNERISGAGDVLFDVYETFERIWPATRA